MSFESEVMALHSEGRLDDSLIDVFLPGGKIRPIEGPMWDYKTGFCLPLAQIEDEACFLCELLKDIVGLYNAFGGYLIIAYRDDQAAHFAKFIVKDDFDKLADRYLKAYVPIAPFKTSGLLDGARQNLLFIQVDKRGLDRTPVPFNRNAADKKGGGKAFSNGDIVLRHGSSTMIVNQRPELLVFAFGPRKPDVGEFPIFDGEAWNNLPPRDPNLIEFVGRRDYLAALWSWLADPRNPVKILAALGGTGKTAIAYEFCEQVVKARTKAFERVIWLTAKSRTYAAILKEYVSTTRTDFTDIDSFLDAFLREIGCLESDFSDFEQIDDKLEFAREMIKDIPVLLIVDDLDSLDQDKQIELYSRTAQLFDQALGGKAQSRVLFTSRLEPNAGGNRIIKVDGFSKPELGAYLDVIVPSFPNGQSWIADVIGSLDDLHAASKGSPIFVASILRIVSFGEPVGKAIEHWRDKDGEDVRRFAFQKEIENLGYPDWRVLYVLQLLSATTFEELKDILNEDRPRLQASLLKLSQFHMFAGNSSPATGTQVSVPEPIRLMVSLTEDKLRRDDVEDLKRKCARVTRQTDGQTDIGRLIRSVSLLWRQNKFPEALIEAQRASAANPKSGELSCILGRTYLLQSPPDFDAADNAFKDAHLKRCSRHELIEYWAYTRLRLGKIAELMKITDFKDNAAGINGVALLYRFAGLYRVARDREGRGDHTKAVETYRKLIDEIREALDRGLTEPVTADVQRLGSESANYALECAQLAFGGANPRLFDLAAELAALKLPPVRALRKVVAVLMEETETLERSAVKRDSKARFTSSRLRGLSVLRRAIVEARGTQDPILVSISLAENQLRRL